MKNKKLIASTGAIIVALGVSSTPIYLGSQAEKVLNSQYELLKDSSIIEIQSREYHRGWFSSTEKMVVKFKPTLLNNASEYLPDNIKTILAEPITVTNHISHGPFGAGEASAKVVSSFQYSSETDKVLKRFFNTQVPLTITNYIHSNGTGKLEISIPAFDYEELSGIKLSWKGFSGTTTYGAQWQTYANQYAAPSLHIKLADKGDIGFENLNITSDSRPGKNNITLGSSGIKIDKLTIAWKEGIDYNVRLSEVIRLATNLQIGSFINPSGTIAPSSITVSGLQFDTKTDENETWINSEGRFRFQKLDYGNDTYGPLDIDVAAEHIDAKGLVALKNKMAQIASTEMTQEEIQASLIETARTEAASLFTENPVFKLRAFDLHMPQGKVHADGQLTFNGLTVLDMNDIATMLKKTKADFNIEVPQQLLQELALNQARSLFSINPEDEAAGRASMEDIDETLRLMVDSTIKTMQDQGYVKLEDGQVSSRIEIADNTLKFNGHIFEQEPEPEFDDFEDMNVEDEEIEEETASDASSEVASEAIASSASQASEVAASQ